MKKLVALMIVALFASVNVFANPFNPTESADATFECKVIAPLAWTAPQDIVLEEVIANQTRDIDDVAMVFALTGEPNYDITVNTTGPTLTSGTGSVSLDGSWSTTPTALDASGEASVTYTVDKIVSGASTDGGTYVFEVSVDAVYSAL
ncbi:MAG: hypothetical protein ACLFR2_06635 [Candidatus Kapaibacterium sp.]